FSKVLASRLARVIGTLIPKTQSAFLKGRQLVDGVVAINEAIDFAKKSGKECMILKVDFEKAYDSVDWGFLDYMLGRFGFSPKWRAWMKSCVCGGNLSVLVNGCPTEEIQIRRGLKQGDPLAPLLFILVVEGLGGLMRRAVEVNKFRPFLVGGVEVPVSLLQYADDTLCIGEATVENLWVLKAVLRGFEMASGLKVNFWKSCVMGVNVTNEFLVMASDFLNCRIGRTPFKYLGLPVGANSRKMSTWEPMMDVIKGRLNSWGNKYVSLGGRIVL
ncbi:cytochrome p450, partial [Trifolium pratense]